MTEMDSRLRKRRQYTEEPSSEASSPACMSSDDSSPSFTLPPPSIKRPRRNVKDPSDVYIHPRPTGNRRRPRKEDSLDLDDKTIDRLNRNRDAAERSRLKRRAALDGALAANKVLREENEALKSQMAALQAQNALIQSQQATLSAQLDLLLQRLPASVLPTTPPLPSGDCSTPPVTTPADLAAAMPPAHTSSAPALHTPFVDTTSLVASPADLSPVHQVSATVPFRSGNATPTTLLHSPLTRSAPVWPEQHGLNSSQTPSIPSDELPDVMLRRVDRSPLFTSLPTRKGGHSSCQKVPLFVHQRDRQGMLLQTGLERHGRRVFSMWKVTATMQKIPSSVQTQQPVHYGIPPFTRITHLLSLLKAPSLTTLRRKAICQRLMRLGLSWKEIHLVLRLYSPSK